MCENKLWFSSSGWLVGWLVVFYCISTLAGYLMLNYIYIYIYIYKILQIVLTVDAICA